MNPFSQNRILLCTVVLSLFSINISAQARAVWSGQGRIVVGPGEGGSVELQLEANSNQITFLSGPSRTEQIELVKPRPESSGLNGSAKTEAGTWEFVQKGNQLGVSLYQQEPYRVIRYVCYPLPTK